MAFGPPQPQAATAPVAPTPKPPSLVQIARQQAQADVQAQQNAVTAQQAADHAAATDTAHQLFLASQGAARFLQPLAGLTRGDYANAINQTRGLAEGYSGQLRTDALNQANAAQATLASIPGNHQTVQSAGGNLADLLYGLRGAVPGQALVTQGLGAVTAARALPAATLGQGQLEGLGAIAAGNAQAARLNPQLAVAAGKLPGLTQSYLGTLTKANAPKDITTAGGGIYRVTPDGHITTLREPTKAPASLHYFSDANGTYSYDPATGVRTRIGDASASAASSGTFTLSPGGARYDANGNLIASRPAAPAKPTTSQIGDSTTGRATVTTYPDGRQVVKPLPGRFGKPSGGSSTASGGLSASKQADVFKQGITLAQAGLPKQILGQPVGGQTYEETLPGVVAYFAQVYPRLTPVKVQKIAVQAMRSAGWQIPRVNPNNFFSTPGSNKAVGNVATILRG